MIDVIRRGRGTVIVALGLVIASLLFSACDEVHGLRFENSTRSEVVLNYRMWRESNPNQILENRRYLIPPMTTIDTTSDRSVDGQVGLDIFREGYILEVVAEHDGTTVYDEKLTYGEVKDMKFHVLLSRVE